MTALLPPGVKVRPGLYRYTQGLDGLPRGTRGH
jgi:hypothetical protein